MKIVVIGAGAMGSIYGGHLSQNNEVYIVDTNQSVVDAINANGLQIDENGVTNTYHPTAVTSTEGITDVDLVILFVKAIFSKVALEGNKNIIGEHTHLLTLQNGAGHEHLLIVAADIGQQFVRHIPEPAFMLFDAPTLVATLVRPSLPVDTIHTDHPDPSGINQRSQYIEHVIILPIIETSVLTRESQKSLSVVTEDLVFHLAAEIMAPPFVIFYVHILLFTITSIKQESIPLFCRPESGDIGLITHGT